MSDKVQSRMMPAKTQGTAMRRSQGKAPKRQATAKPATKSRPQRAPKKAGAATRRSTGAATKRSPAAAARKSSRPRKSAGKAARIEGVRKQVARRRPGQPPVRKVPHAQEDPSIMAPPAPPAPPVDGLHQNWGDAKNRGVARLDKPTNWFRQAAKPKSK